MEFVKLSHLAVALHWGIKSACKGLHAAHGCCFCIHRNTHDIMGLAGSDHNWRQVGSNVLQLLCSQTHDLTLSSPAQGDCMHALK